MPYDAESMIAGTAQVLSAGEALRSKDAQCAELLERLSELSPRQKEVLQLVAEGLSNEQIALRLGASALRPVASSPSRKGHTSIKPRAAISG